MCHETIIDNAKVRISENNTKYMSFYFYCRAKELSVIAKDSAGLSLFPLWVTAN